MIASSVIEAILDRIIRREGGFTNNPADRGGPTNLGITLEKLGEWKGKPVSIDDIRYLPEEIAREIYRHDFIEKPGFLAIDDLNLFDLVVDSAVNHGPERAAKFLQEALHVESDGDIGPKTLMVLSRSWTPQVYRDVVAARLRFYGRLISRDRDDADKDGLPDASEFASGWLNRLAEFVVRCPCGAGPIA